MPIIYFEFILLFDLNFEYINIKFFIDMIMDEWYNSRNDY